MAESSRPEAPPESPAERHLAIAGRALLLLPLLALLMGIGGNDRPAWPDLAPREASVLMMAGSLLEDHDLEYTRLDFDRLLLAWRGNPPDLELTSGSDGRRITYRYPFVYPLYLAPFLAFAPERGIALANILLLLAALLAAARALAPRLGGWSPWVLLAWIFGSVVFAGVFRADGDVFLLSCSLLAASLWLAAETLEGRAARRALFAGALLAPVVLVMPVALLLLPLLIFSASGEARRMLAPRLLAGAALGVLLLVLVHWWNGGGLYFAATSSFKFTPATGYPAVDFPAEKWVDEVRILAAQHWEGAPRLAWGYEPLLLGWNLLYFLAGSQLGLLPYFLPLLILLALRPRPLAFVTLAYMVYLLALHPFNFWLGPGALGNRALYPLYGAAIVALPPLRDRLAALGRRPFLGFLLLFLAVAPFLWELWRDPSDWPYRKTAYDHQTAIARGLLPHEASQRWLPGGAIEEIDGLFIAAIDENTWVEKGNGRLGVAGEKAAFLVVSLQRLPSLLIEMDAGAPNEIVVHGGQQVERILRPDGGIGFRVEPEVWRRHAMWFSPLPMYIYRLELELPLGRTENTLFRLSPEWPARMLQ
jgi:hypothetical protein